MPVHGLPKGEPGGPKGLVLAALALLAGVGCIFDFSIPTIPPTPPPPALNVLAPRPGDTVTLTAEVSVQAESVNGLSSVSLLCGPLDGGARVAYVWPSPPYLALVDLSVCEGLTTPNPDGGPISELQLSVQAVSTVGADSGVDLQVFLDATGPLISVQYPPTAQPKSPFTVVVSSNDPLGSLPVVALAGNAADSVVSVPPPDGGPYNYIASFQSTPGLGTDVYCDGGPCLDGQLIPIEVLTDTDEVVRLTVSATGLNGNTTAVDLSVDLSRLVWDRYIPGQPASSSPITWAAEPIAFSGGLVLPLATTSFVSGTGATADWIPGVLSFVDGTFYGFDATSLPGGLDGGYLARGLNGQGQTLFLDFTGNGSNLLLAPAPPATGPVVTGTLTGPQVSPPLTNVSGADGGPPLLCLPDTANVCSDAIIEGLTCFSPQLATVSAMSGVTFSGPPDAGVVAGAGGSYLSPNVAVCGSSWNLVDLVSGTVSFGPIGDPNGTARSCFIQGIARLLAVGDGTFVVQLISACDDQTGLPEYPILRVGPGPANGESAILGTYTAPLGTPRTVQRELVGVLADGRIVTLSNNPPNTDFELWSMNPTVVDPPDVTTSVAGLYDSADATEGSVVARSVHSGADGSFAVLLSGAPLGVAVMAFGPNLQPLWLYLYGRVTPPANARLVSAPSVGDVYLVDEFNNRAASLRVEPPGSAQGLQPPSDLTYSTNPAVYTDGTAIAANTPKTSGGKPTAFTVSPALPAGLSLDAVTGIITGTPTAVTATAAYTVTASNAAGGAMVSLTITVNVATTLSYSTNPAVYTVGTQIAMNVPTFTGGTPTGYVVSPALPAGLSLNASNGDITGTPTTASGALVYTITASSPVGVASVGVSITVNPAGTCTLCLIATPSVVQVVSGGNLISLILTATAPSTFSGNLTFATFVPPASINITPNPPSPAYIMSGTTPAGYGSYLEVSAAAGLGPETEQVSVTGSAAGLGSDTITFTVDVVAAPTITVSPAAVTLATGAMQQFTATVTGAGSVIWSVVEGPTGGSISSTSGLYTAPTSTTGTFHVQAASTLDSSDTAEAVVTVVGG
ncbi:MAG: putative Ig domain-containing protein [Myxococcaceae bacterium]